MILKNKRGFTLFQLVMILIGLGMAAAVAVRFMYFSTEESRKQKTVQKMKRIVEAIHGNSEIVPQTNFGFLGDMRRLPTSLDELVNVVSGGEWNGPYYTVGFQEDTDDILNDAWGQPFSYNSATGIISSTGGGTTLTQQFTLSPIKLVTNSIEGKVVNKFWRIPQGLERFQFSIVLTHLGNAGTKTSPTWSTSLNSQGKFYYSNLTAGNYLLTVTYDRYGESINKFITIPPLGTTYKLTIRFSRTFA